MGKKLKRPWVCNSCPDNCQGSDVAIVVNLFETKDDIMVNVVKNGSGFVLTTHMICRLQDHICLGKVTNPYPGMLSCKERKVPVLSRIALPEGESPGIWASLSEVKSFLPKVILAKIIEDLAIDDLVKKVLDK